jgi:N,N'-diacetyllegionaminate synthase
MSIMVDIVSEIGVNWNGDFQIVEEMISASKNAGCNAVKFQAFTMDQIKSHPECQMLIKTSISENNIDKINQIANDIGIEWFCTPMYPEIIKVLDPFVKRFKLREFDGRNLIENNQTPLTKSLLDTGKEIIVSSQKSPKKCNYYENKQIKWLYCVPKYPCSIDDINFNDIHDFNGYSNHCVDSIVPISAAVLGAEIIEIHVTLDKNGKYVDNNVSFDFKEFKKIIDNIRKIEHLKK